MDSNNSVNSVTANTAKISPLNLKEIKAKILNGDFKIIDKRGRSKIWDIFGSVANENREVIYGVLACKSCLNLYKQNDKCTSNLVRHKCYITSLKTKKRDAPMVCVDGEWRKKGTRAFTKWVLENCRPYKIPEDSGFQDVAEYLVSVGIKYGKNVNIASAIPDRTTISRNVEHIYGLTFEKVKGEIDLVRNVGFGLASDIWTDDYFKKSYIALTIHYIKDGNLLTRLLGLQSMEEERCTHENIRKKVGNILMEFDCDLNNKAIIVTDRGSNMTAAFRSFQHIYCIKHLINNALDKAMEEESAVVDLCGLCSKLVNYIKNCGINLSVPSTINSYSPTRWNTTYCLLKSIQQNSVEINQILQETNELHRINNINLTQLEGIITILEQFEESIKELEGEHHPTIYLTLMHINHLVKKCSPESADQTMVKEFKERLRINLETIVIKNLTVYHKMALFLFPPANKMIQFDEGDKKLVKDQCKLMMRAYQSEIPVQRHGDEVIQLSASNQELFADYVTSTEDINGDLALDYELLMYEKNNVTFHDDFNILYWWNQNKTEFPLLFQVSCQILATPASTAAPERIFSLARKLISEKNSHISANMNYVNQIIFVNVNIEKDNMLRELNSLT